ncbi:MAG: hypothetical protein ACRCWY_12650 [Cellulosilyticaceae bacterium]
MNIPITIDTSHITSVNGISSTVNVDIDLSAIWESFVTKYTHISVYTTLYVPILNPLPPSLTAEISVRNNYEVASLSNKIIHLNIACPHLVAPQSPAQGTATLLGYNQKNSPLLT